MGIQFNLEGASRCVVTTNANMKALIVLSALVAIALADSEANADPQLLISGAYPYAYGLGYPYAYGLGYPYVAYTSDCKNTYGFPVPCAQEERPERRGRPILMPRLSFPMVMVHMPMVPSHMPMG